jgi:hypothetical protein
MDNLEISLINNTSTSNIRDIKQWNNLLNAQETLVLIRVEIY